jgi:tripartite-type tricarboxylate transporter receptor subunit TctC
MFLSNALFAFTLAAGISAATYAQAYPVKPVRMILPFPAGTGADAVTRVVSEKLAQIWGQPVVVDNRPGAGGTLGVALVSRAQADGYVLLAHTSTYSVSAAVYAKLPYDPGRDFHALAAIGTQPYLLVTAPNAGWKQVSDLIAAAKARPGRMDYGSAGVGSSTHLVAAKFRRAAGIEAVHVPYRSIADAMSDTIAGRIGYWFPPLGGALALVRDGRVVALGVTGHKRSGFLPQVRTFTESGLPGLDEANWFGVWAPAGTPARVIDRVARDIANAVANPDVRGRLEATGTEPLSLNAADFARFVRAETERAAIAVESAGIPRQ